MKRIKNADTVVHTWCGQEILPDEYYTIQASEEYAWASDSILLTAISDGVAVVNDGVEDIADVNSAIDFLKSAVPQKFHIESIPPFADKFLGGMRIYRRVHGIQASLSQGENTVVWSVPYDWAKITCVEIVGGECLDYASLFVLDSSTGIVSGIPNFTLNQFGFNVNVSAGFYESRSKYDADLYKDLQLKVVYNSLSAKTIGINFILDEVKT